MFDKDYWQGFWRTDDTPWTGEKVNDTFFENFGRLVSLIGKPEPQIDSFVPLCGNSPAVRFLYERGTRVTGLEYVPEALERLRTEEFSELAFSEERSTTGVSFSAPRIRLLEQDIFTLHLESQFDLIYDRGALVALPPQDWPRYSPLIAASLKPGGLLFLRCAEFIGGNFQGPPFSLDGKSARECFAGLRLLEEQIETIVPTQERFLQAGVKQTNFRNIIFRR